MALRLIVSQRNKSMSEMDTDGKIFVGKGTKPEFLTLALANRHGLVTGATGTGKTVTLQVLAEGFRAPASRSSPPTSRATSPASPRRARPRTPSSSAPRSIGFDYEPDQFPVDVLGPVRRAGPSDPRHHLGDGAAAAVAPARSQRRAGRRAQHRLPHRRRAGAAAARPQGPARDARLRRRERGRAHDANTATCRRRPSAPSSASCWCWRTRAAPSSSASRRSTLEGFHAHRPRRPRHHQHPRRRQADGEPAALRDLPAVAAVGAVRAAARGRRSRQAEARASSSTRRICCSTTRRRRCSTRSSRSCA